MEYIEKVVQGLVSQSQPSAETMILGTVGLFIILVGLGLLFSGLKSKTPLVMRTKDRRFIADTVRQLDPRFAHVHAIFLYPKQVSWERGERNPERNMPRLRVVVNTKTKKAFWMGPYAMSLFHAKKIQYVTGNASGEAEMREYVRTKGYLLVENPASEADLLENST